MNFEILALTLTACGEILVAYTAIRVHYRFRKEHKIDNRVFAAMKNEQGLGILGIILLISGYALQIFVRI